MLQATGIDISYFSISLLKSSIYSFCCRFRYFGTKGRIHQCLAVTVSVQLSRVPPSHGSKTPSQVPDMLPFSMRKAHKRSGSQAVTVKFVE